MAQIIQIIVVMKVAIFVVFTLFVVNVFCQSPPVHAMCDIPDEYSGTLTQIIVFDGCQAAETNFGELYYSYSQERVRVDIADGKTNIGGTTTTYTISVWQDFKNKIEYVLDRSDNTCTSFPLTTHIGSGQLPADARYGGAILVGSQPVHEYWYPTTYNGQTYHIEVGLNSGTCLPFDVNFFNATASGTPQKLVLAESIFNAVPYIPPFVMEIPSICTSQSLASEVANKISHIRHALAMHSFAFSR